MTGSTSKTLIVFGCMLVAAGLLMPWLGRLTWFGKLPGDMIIRRGNFTFYFPLMTCILISLLLTFLFSVLGRK